MTGKEMTSLDRVFTALGHEEPDRVPFLLPATFHGAKELGMSLVEYFSRPENVVEGQMRVRAKYRHDIVTAFFYGAVDFEAWGGEVLFFDDGPPNSGEPFIRGREDIKGLEPPKVEETLCLLKGLEATRMLREKVAGDAPVLGVAISPFSLPVMQMGFDRYIELLYEDREAFWMLMRVNEEFCTAWANAQVEAGANAIAYFDPVSSPTCVPRELYLETGFLVAGRTIPRINAPALTHLASAICLPIVDDLARTGTAGVGVSALEDLAELKRVCAGRLNVVGNLNGIEMRHWSAAEAEEKVKEAIAAAARGGGYVLSDNHGEIPFQVPDEVLLAISDAVEKWGRYPVDWT